MAEEELVEPFEEEELVGGCFTNSIWGQMCANTPDLENATLEEIEAFLDPPLLQRRISNCLSPRGRPNLQVSQENCNPVPPKQVSMPCAGPTSSSSGTGVPKAVQHFSGLNGCTFNFYQS